MSHVIKTMIKKSLNKEDWRQKYFYAHKLYGQIIDEIPVKGEQSFTYIRPNGDTIIVYYELKSKA